jgi:phosphatidate cytidylyltransferase
VKGTPWLKTAGGAGMGRSTPEWVLRINSALVLAAFALTLTYVSPHAFAILITLFITAMAWEWGRLVRGKGFDPAFGVQLAATAIAAWTTVEGCPGCGLLTVLIGTMAVFVIRSLSVNMTEAWWSAGGVYYAGIPAISLVWIRGDEQFGWLAILYLFAIVWTTDTAAYIFGRAIGGPKLAPRVSPKKTWSGFLGGALCAALVGSLFGAWMGETDLVKLASLSLVLAVAAQLGDLGESAMKRIFGTKDSSGLIPGHGGVLDRIDGLIFVAFTAALLSWALDPSRPGRALLIWS